MARKCVHIVVGNTFKWSVGRLFWGKGKCIWAPAPDGVLVGLIMGAAFLNIKIDAAFSVGPLTNVCASKRAVLIHHLVPQTCGPLRGVNT